MRNKTLTITLTFAILATIAVSTRAMALPAEQDAQDNLFLEFLTGKFEDNSVYRRLAFLDEQMMGALDVIATETNDDSLTEFYVQTKEDLPEMIEADYNSGKSIEERYDNLTSELEKAIAVIDNETNSTELKDIYEAIKEKAEITFNEEMNSDKTPEERAVELDKQMRNALSNVDDTGALVDAYDDASEESMEIIEDELAAGKTEEEIFEKFMTMLEEK